MATLVTSSTPEVPSTWVETPVETAPVKRKVRLKKPSPPTTPVETPPVEEPLVVDHTLPYKTVDPTKMYMFIEKMIHDTTGKIIGICTSSQLMQVPLSMVLTSYIGSRTPGSATWDPEYADKPVSKEFIRMFWDEASQGLLKDRIFRTEVTPPTSLKSAVIRSHNTKAHGLRTLSRVGSRSLGLSPDTNPVKAMLIKYDVSNIHRMYKGLSGGKVFNEEALMSPTSGIVDVMRDRLQAGCTNAVATSVVASNVNKEIDNYGSSLIVSHIYMLEITVGEYCSINLDILPEVDPDIS